MSVIVINKFLGLDMTKRVDDDISCSPEMLNFRITENFSLKKRGGIKAAITKAGESIDGMWSGYIGSNFMLLFTADGYLFRHDYNTGIYYPIGEVGAGRCAMFEFGGKVYILNGNGYYRYDGTVVEAVEGYVPLIAVGCSASGAGTAFEQLNLLTGKRRQQFSADGSSVVYSLAEKNINYVNYVKINGVSTTQFTCNTVAGTITFSSAPLQGINNIEICYTKGNLDRSRITCNRFAMLFGGNVDGRLFLWGHPSYPNYRFHSDLADGVPSVEYFPENNYTVIGNTEITDIVSQYDRQLIFTKDRAFYSFCELKQDKLGAYYSSFPVYNLNGEKGNLISGSSCIMNNEPVTFCNDGLNRWCSTVVENEKNAICFSSPVSPVISGIIKKADFSEIRLFDFQTNSELYFIYKGKAYIFNYKLGVWYVYDNFYADCICDCKGELYFSYEGSIFMLSESETDDEKAAVTAFWKSPFFSAGKPFEKKDVTELMLTTEIQKSMLLDLTVNSDVNPSNVFSDSFLITGPQISCIRTRPNVRRASKVQIYIRAEGMGNDAEIHEASITTKPKGRVAGNEQ